ncbi:MAG: TatD family hydrolase [Fimbriimonadaceae bacterium]
MRLTDTHCHLNLAEYFPDPDAEIERAKTAGVDRIVNVGIDLESSRRAVEIAERHEGVFAVVGWHPNSSHQMTADGLAAVRELAGHEKVVAWGEIGLDYHWTFATPEQQREALRRQLEVAAAVGLPVVFHCREAYDDLLYLLERIPKRPYLFHCFAGDALQAERALALGALLGVDGPVTYKKSQGLRALLGATPKDRWVLETDAPFLSPEPFRGKPNTPARIPLINAVVASVWGMSVEDAAETTTANACRFFGLR